MATDACLVHFVDEERVASVRENMAPDDSLVDVAEIFKVLGDPTRARIINALSVSDLCVCDLTSLLGMSQSAVSHQLRLLRTAKLVKFRKKGKMAYYSLVDGHVKNLFEEGLRHVKEG